MNFSHTARLLVASMLLLVIPLTSAACSTSKINRTIAALDAAAVLPAALGLPAETQKCAAEAFKGVSTAVAHFRDNPSADAFDAVQAAVARLEVSACVKNPRLATIVTVVVRMIESIVPAPTLAADEALTPAERIPSLKNLDDNDLKELERLTRTQ